MVPFKETIQTKEELINAVRKGFEDYSARLISKNDFCMFFGFTHGEAITKFYLDNSGQLLIDGGFNSGSEAYFNGGIRAWQNLKDDKYTFPPILGTDKVIPSKERLRQEFKYYLEHVARSSRRTEAGFNLGNTAVGSYKTS